MSVHFSFFIFKINHFSENQRIIFYYLILHDLLIYCYCISIFLTVSLFSFVSWKRLINANKNTNASKAGNAVFESINLYIYLFFRNKRFISNNFVCASKVRVLSFTELLDGGGAIRNGKREWKGKKTEKKGL